MSDRNTIQEGTLGSGDREMLQRALTPGEITGRDTASLSEAQCGPHDHGAQMGRAMVDQYQGMVTGRGPVAAQATTGGYVKPLNVEYLNVGVIVTIGCHRFAVSRKKAAKLIPAYILNPEETERQWFAGELEIKAGQ
jgi:hypothetical protein